MTRTTRQTIPFTYYRGGTSKALLLHEEHLPPPGEFRDGLILRLYGSPDPMQIDGMGGTHPVTSKVAIISRSTRENVDVDYLFGQVSIKEAKVSWDGGCGNISAAVGPFAIDEKLVHVDEKSRTQRRKEVRIWMVGTGTLLVASVPIWGHGGVQESGDVKIDGCPGTGAGILMDYKHTAGGAVKRGMLPTGKPVNQIQVRGQEVPVTICDIAHIIVFGRAKDFEIEGSEDSKILNANKQLIDDMREFRGRAAEMVGICSSWEKVDKEAPNRKISFSNQFPYVVLLSAAPDDDGHVQARLFLDNHCHTAMAGAGATCTAACSRIEGTLVNQIARKPQDGQEEFRVRHPLGHLPIQIKEKPRDKALKKRQKKEESQLPEFETLSFVRTARKIAKGELFVPEDFAWGEQRPDDGDD